MRIAIVDDEQAAGKAVEKLLERNFPQFTVCGIYNKLADAAEGINIHQPELVFLDVELDKKQTGFDLLEKIPLRTFEVIFVTAYNTFAASAFQYSALHYIQKPIDENLFVQAVNKAIETMKMKDFSKRLDLFMDGKHVNLAAPEKIMVPNLKGDQWICLDVNQIVRVSTEGKQLVRITYEEKDKFLFTAVRKYIGEVEKMLEGPDFIRVHESHLINIKHIKTYNRDYKTVMLSDKTEVEISRRSIGLLMDKIKKL